MRGIFTCKNIISIENHSHIILYNYSTKRLTDKGVNRMKMNMLFMLFLITFSLSDQRHFVWTYEYKTVSRGEVEFEHYYTTSHPNASDLSVSAKTGHQLELEIGMNERFDFAVYHQFEQQESFIYKGYKLRGRYRIGEKTSIF